LLIIAFQVAKFRLPQKVKTKGRPRVTQNFTKRKGKLTKPKSSGHPSTSEANVLVSGQEADDNKSHHQSLTRMRRQPARYND